VTLTRGGATTSYRFNTGDGQYFAILRPQGTVTTVTRVFPQTPLPNLVSFPVRPLSVQADVALGLPPTDFLLNTWDNVSGTYKAFSAVQAAGARLEPGTGYWLKVGGAGGNATVRLTGTPPPSDTDFTIAAPLGWSLIGSPFGTDINLSDILVQFLQGDPIPWDEAVGNFVQAQVYGFDQNATSGGGYVETDVLRGSEWKGYWIRARVPGGCNADPAGSGLSDAQPGSSRHDHPLGGRADGAEALGCSARKRKPEWSVRLTAEQNTGAQEFANRDTATLGAAKDATRGVDAFWDVEAPPAIVPGVQVAFEGGNATGSRDRRAPGRRLPGYGDGSAFGDVDVTVSTPVSGLATLRWEGVGTAPRQTRLTLVDTVTGTRIPLRSRSSYTWTGEAGKTRAFRVLSEPERSLPLSISNVNVQQIRNLDGTRSVGGGGGLG
jgi:hypothetical protein